MMAHNQNTVFLSNPHYRHGSMMFLVFFCSGGKDSCYNLIECVREGHEVVALGNLKPAQKGVDLLYTLINPKRIFLNIPSVIIYNLPKSCTINVN